MIIARSKHKLILWLLLMSYVSFVPEGLAVDFYKGKTIN